MSTVDATRPASTRVSIARLAEQVVARTDGVSATQGRGRWLTRDGERTIAGVVVGETASGRVEVGLHLIADWPPRPLPPLGDQLRWELVNDATRSGLGERIGEVSIAIHDLADPNQGAAR